MRFTIAYYLMLLYITVVIKPIVPFVQDAWGHEFNEIEHISLIHAKYGSNHLERELAGADTDSGKTKNQSALRTEDQVPFHIIVNQCGYENMVSKHPKPYFRYKHNKLPFIYIVSQGQPPEFS